MKNSLEFQDVSLIYGKLRVLDHLNLTLHQGQKTVIMGASGSGKTSLLRLSAGLLSPTHGKVIRHAKRVAVQFQEPRLLPHLTALQNINVVLSDSQESLPLAREWLERVELGDAANLLPAELSGGMAQRVALARALAYGGDLYLLDEPFRGLDAELKARMVDLVLEATKDATLMLITHDPEVAEKFTTSPVILTSSDAETTQKG